VEVIKYFGTAFAIVVFVIFTVWQNIEVMKIRLDVSRLEKDEREILKKNDSILYRIEKMKRIDKISSEAGERNIKKITPGDLIVLKIKNQGDNGKQQ
jgi:exosome complex RNA-binding protein Rrp4